MAIDLSAETLLSLSQAAKRLPPLRTDRPVSPATVWRWIIKGTRRADGIVVRLEACKIGSRYVTSVEALDRYVQGLNGTYKMQPAPSRKRAHKKAKRQVAAAGI
jgi:hypothetical protein